MLFGIEGLRARDFPRPISELGSRTREGNPCPHPPMTVQCCQLAEFMTACPAVLQTCLWVWLKILLLGPHQRDSARSGLGGAQETCVCKSQRWCFWCTLLQLLGTSLFKALFPTVKIHQLVVCALMTLDKPHRLSMPQFLYLGGRVASIPGYYFCKIF